MTVATRTSHTFDPGWLHEQNWKRRLWYVDSRHRSTEMLTDICVQEIESRISKASTQDEALRRAIKAAELYMQAMGVAVGNHERTRLKAKCQMLLQSAESLKKANTRQQAKAPAVLKEPVSARTFTTKERVILLESSRLNGFISKTLSRINITGLRFSRRQPRTPVASKLPR